MKPKLLSASRRWFYLLTVVSALLLALMAPEAAFAAWKVYYTGEAARMFGSHGRGSFATKNQCEDYLQSSPGFERNNSYCYGSDSPSSGGSSSGSSSRGLSHKNQMKLDILQGAMDEFANAFIKWVNSPPPTPKGPTPEQIELHKQDEERKKQEEIRKKQEALAKWKMLQDEEAFNRARENELKRKAGQDLLSKMDPVGGGTLTPFRWEQGKDAGLRFQPVGAGQYPTAKFSSLERLKCAAYFSSNAKNASNKENARFYSEQADKVMAGQPTNMECRFPPGAEPPDPGSADMVLQKLAKISIDYREKVEELQETEEKLGEVKKQVKEAESKRDTAQNRLWEAQNHAATTRPEEKAAADTLAAEALAALQEAERELNTAKDSEAALIKEKETIEKGIEEMEKQVKLVAGK